VSEPGALTGLKVLDFTRVLAGPFATMMLGDLGAAVVKVERPGTGDETRSWGPPFDADGHATYFQAVNRNKSSLTLDFGLAEDVAEAVRLAAHADVVVENFRPGVLDALGLGYEDLRARNPGLIYCSITGFGSGDGASLPGYDLILQAVGGLMSITGSPDGGPEKAGVAVVDVLAGLFATVGILAALRHRERTGEGQRVEVDLLSSLLAALVNQGAAYTIAGVVPTRMGSSHPSIAPYELLPTAEGELVLAIGNERQFADLCRVLGAPELAGDPRFASNAERVANREALRAELERLAAARPAAEWARRLTASRVPAGTVNDLGAAFALAADLGLDPVVKVPREDGTSMALTRNPIGLSRTPVDYRMAPPRLTTLPRGDRGAASRRRRRG
jgi:crotonobetainyl-CoA:carnitine CoA-transferase CaiB-like acyl-CoA transferase